MTITQARSGVRSYILGNLLTCLYSIVSLSIGVPCTNINITWLSLRINSKSLVATIFILVVSVRVLCSYGVLSWSNNLSFFRRWTRLTKDLL